MRFTIMERGAGSAFTFASGAPGAVCDPLFAAGLAGAALGTQVRSFEGAAAGVCASAALHIMQAMKGAIAADFIADQKRRCT